jgi:hypothetical protein
MLEDNRIEIDLQERIKELIVCTKFRMRTSP